VDPLDFRDANKRILIFANWWSDNSGGLRPGVFEDAYSK